MTMCDRHPESSAKVRTPDGELHCYLCWVEAVYEDQDGSGMAVYVRNHQRRLNSRRVRYPQLAQPWYSRRTTR